MDAAEVARVLHVTTKTLYNWRASGAGPPGLPKGFHLNRKVLYVRAEIEAFLRRQQKAG
jgi:predicted DNA-binding transcriptional regulator AlpA